MIMKDATKIRAHNATHQYSAKCTVGDIVGLLLFEVMLLWILWPVIRALYRVL